MKLKAIMLSCEARRSVSEQTLASFASTDWGEEPELIFDDELGETPLLRIHRTWHRVVTAAARTDAAFVLMLEDDLVLCKALRHNLERWPLLRTISPSQAFLASLYNPGRPFLEHNATQNYRVAHPESVWGAQAVLINPATARYLLRHWHDNDANPDIKMARLVSRVALIYYHSPSLVDHLDVPTTWGGFSHRAVDFDAEWRSPASIEASGA